MENKLRIFTLDYQPKTKWGPGSKILDDDTFADLVDACNVPGYTSKNVKNEPSTDAIKFFNNLKFRKKFSEEENGFTLDRKDPFDNFIYHLIQ